MKKAVALLLAFALIFCLAACKNQVALGEETTQETTGKPGDWITNADGEVQTVTRSYLLTEENGEMKTEIVTNADGSEQAVPVTTFVYDVATYPGATQPATVPPGYTLASTGKAWPTESFMSALPVLSETVDDIDLQTNEKGDVAILYFNEVSYADYLKYVDKCKAAGFEQTSGSTLPETETDGESYIYYSASNGLYVGITYNTDSAPYRNCDVRISVANYSVYGGSETASEN